MTALKRDKVAKRAGPGPRACIPPHPCCREACRPPPKASPQSMVPSSQASRPRFEPFPHAPPFSSQTQISRLPKLMSDNALGDCKSQPLAGGPRFLSGYCDASFEASPRVWVNGARIGSLVVPDICRTQTEVNRPATAYPNKKIGEPWGIKMRTPMSLKLHDVGHSKRTLLELFRSSCP